MSKKTSKKVGKKLSQPTRASIRKAAKKAVGRTKHNPLPDEPVKRRGGYAVEVENPVRDLNQKLVSVNFIAYVGSKRMPLTLKEAESHRDGIKRTGAGGRIITVPDGSVHETWEGVAQIEAAKREEDMSQALEPPSVEEGQPKKGDLTQN
jgi:hypothetical protein